MKKTYMQPALEVVDIQFSQALLAGSIQIDVNKEDVTDPEELLAPGMPSVNDMLGIPSVPGLPF